MWYIFNFFTKWIFVCKIFLYQLNLKKKIKFFIAVIVFFFFYIQFLFFFLVLYIYIYIYILRHAIYLIFFFSTRYFFRFSRSSSYDVSKHRLFVGFKCRNKCCVQYIHKLCVFKKHYCFDILINRWSTPSWYNDKKILLKLSVHVLSCWCAQLIFSQLLSSS